VTGYERIRRDPRYNNFIEYCKQRGLQPQPVEIDAFAGLFPSEFKREIEKWIKKHFSMRAYRELRRLEREYTDEAKKLLEKLKQLISSM